VDVAGKAAIVTGGSSGVGAATAQGLAQLGCSVLVNYSRSQPPAEEVAERCRSHGVKAVAHRADVSDDGECRAMVDAAVQTFGRLDVLINNAGTTVFVDHDDLEGVKDPDWDRIFAVNLKGPFYCTRAARPALEAAGGGEVVMTSSIAGLVGRGSSIPYCASKGALNNLTVTLARALGPSNIRVNGVAPGFIEGPWLREGLGEERFEALKRGFEAMTPLGRICTPEEVAAAITSLITGSDLVTGSVLPVESGFVIGR